MPKNPFALKLVVAVVVLVCAVNILTMATARWAAGAGTEQMVTAALSMARGPQGGMSDAQRESSASMMRPMMQYYPVTTAISVLIMLLVLSTVFYGALAVTDAGLRWPVVFGAAAYAALAQAIAGLALVRRPPTHRRPAG